jgi:hypothetical protein
VAFFVIAALVLLLWLLVRPLDDEPLALRDEAPSIFAVEDRARCSQNLADADAPDSSVFTTKDFPEMTDTETALRQRSTAGRDFQI